MLCQKSDAKAIAGAQGAGGDVLDLWILKVI